MDGISFSLDTLSPEVGLLAGACALILVPVVQQLFAELTRWSRKKPDEGDVWSSYNS